MSWDSMSRELAAQCPVPFPFCRTLVNRAWLEVQRAHQWSFLWFEVPIPTPSPISAGIATYSIGLNLVTGDATASAAWLGAGLAVPLTTRQFRIGTGSFYNIIAVNSANPAAVVLTLDRIFVDPIATYPTTGYQILGCFYNAPFQDFIWWDSVRDPYSGYAFNLTETREHIDRVDPQRFTAGMPTACIPYKVNQQPGAFFGFPMYEMWPAPLDNYTYIGSGYRSGSVFTNVTPGVTDVVPPQVGEDIVMAKAKMYAYEWCIANTDKAPKGVDFRFVYGASMAEYGKLLPDYIMKDQEFSGRNIIVSQPDSDPRGDLPWLSGSVGRFYLPG